MPLALSFDQSTFISDTFASRLYAACEGFPLWNPSICNLADIGYIRQGTFHVLYNAERGPSSNMPTFSSERQRARRTSPPADRSSSPIKSEMSSGMVVNEQGSPSPPPSEISSSRRVSLSRLFMPLGNSSTGSLDSRSPPLPLTVEREHARVFDMGPRMSSNYKSLGCTVGGDFSLIAGIPLKATISFESDGGTGALLLVKEPVHRHLLRHRGVLKAYFLAHREYIYDTHGEVEDVDLDEMALIYGTDCTSDWACAVTLEAQKGSKVQFEIFTIGHAGVWGDWKTACSAQQRGPYRGDIRHVETNLPNQTVVVRRLTIQSRRFRSMRMKASAELKPDRGDNNDRSRHPAILTGDPIHLVHDYLFESTSADYTMASDDDAICLLKLIKTWDSYPHLQQRVTEEAKKCSEIIIDENGVASLQFIHRHEQSNTTKIIVQTAIRQKQCHIVSAH